MLQRYFRRDQPLSQLYSRFAERWQAGIENLGFPAAYRHLTEHMKARQALSGGAQPKRILDLGTGSGAMAVAFLDQYPLTREVVLIDNCEDMLPIAVKNISRFGVVTDTRLASAESALPDGPYDMVLAAHVIEHTSDPLATLGHIFEALQHGGSVVLSVSKPHWCTALVRWRWGHKAFHPDEVIQMLRMVGFKGIEPVHYRSGPPARVSAGYIATRP